jgi:copper chaperone CopZ
MCTRESSAASAAAQSESTDRTYSVTGMSCRPCATKVTRTVEQIEGVTGVAVDLAAGRLTVAGNATDAAIHTAVTDAGYQIAAI